MRRDAERATRDAERGQHHPDDAVETFVQDPSVQRFALEELAPITREGPGGGHVMWFNPSLIEATTTLQQFVTEMVTDDASWSSVGP
jgi:hypothetical protein